MPKLNVEKVAKADDRSLPIFEEIDRLADRIRVHAYNLFARRGSGEEHALDDWLAAERDICWPSAELTEQDSRYALKVALAGFEPGEISVTATPHEIIVKASHKQETKSKEGEPEVRWTEFHSNDVFRRVELPKAVNVKAVSANLTNGLLEIVAPQAESAEEAAKQVEISTGD